MDRLTFRFRPPEHGWLDVRLECAREDGSTEVHEVVASDVPCDSLEMLVDAICALLDGALEARMEWSLEPSYEVWSFSRDETSGAIRVLVGSPPTSRTGRAPLERPSRAFATTERRSLALGVWRGMRSLESDPIWRSDAAETAWSFPFPESALRRLGERLGR